MAYSLLDNDQLGCDTLGKFLYATREWIAARFIVKRVFEG